jgi:hypothetical protein
MINTCKWYDPSCSLTWLSDEIQAILLRIWDSIMGALASLVEAITPPDFLLNIQSFELPASIAWAAEPLNLEYGVSVIVAAYIARFTLRRIPFIG